MRFRPANISLINSRSTPPTPLAVIVILPCNNKLSKIFSDNLAQRLTGPSITGCDKQRAGTPFRWHLVCAAGTRSFREDSHPEASVR